MSKLEFKKLNGELTELVKLYTSHQWYYHSNPQPSREEIINRYNSGWYESDKESFWVEENGEKIGLIIISDISDTIPLLYDIRLVNKVRGKRYGEICVKWAADYIFKSSEEKIRIESYTRYDNLPMRKVFYKCNFQKEGYLRNSWENDDGSVKDSLVYAIIREDWEKDKKTPIKIDDFPY
ncbi:N-acetyltransferase [Filobacillus milosensis]|uniref:N-acetyltransferase n=1 Tax=Filobacillus milosensis TaxID=94137 RepID=A0A4Y8IB04_9BACI|nr:GNAT family protein [Filobacillus milosensis]TFB13032.1 N-acetyltransferase [Filobacillus milosensis]